MVAALFGASPLGAQDVLDRTDPTIAEEPKAQPQAPREPPPATSIDTVQPSGAAASQNIDVGAIAIVGAKSIPVAAFADIVERYSARTLDTAAIARLTDEIAGRAQSRGYVFAFAFIEPQSLATGLLRVRLDEGRIDRVRVVGGPAAAVRSQLAPLETMSAVSRAQLERHIQLAEDIPGVAIRRTSYAREDGSGVLTVEIARQRAAGFIEFENDGTRPIGPERARLDLDFNGLLMPTDQFAITLSTTPLQPRELQYGRAAYRVLANGGGTVIGISGSLSITEPGDFLAERNILGRSWRAGADVRHPLYRSRTFGLWAEGDFELRDLRQKRGGDIVRHDRVPLARIGLYTSGTLVDGRFRGRLTFTQGLAILGATGLGDPLASRDDASARFSTLTGWTDWERDVARNVSVKLSGRGQLSTAPLLVAEDIGLGGNRFLRAYDYNERTGDEGIMGSAELRYQWRRPSKPIQGLQVYTYADGGVVGNLAGGRGGGSLASAGGGLRAEISRTLAFDLEVAVPLTGPRFDSRDRSPHLALRVRQSF